MIIAGTVITTSKKPRAVIVPMSEISIIRCSRTVKFLSRSYPTGEETAKANKEKLQRLGFQFKYLTHTYTTKTGKTYHYCYDYGYLPLENEWYLIVRRKEE